MYLNTKKKMIKIVTPHKIVYLIDNQQDLPKNSSVTTISSQPEMRKEYQKQVIENPETRAIYFYNSDLKLLFGYFSGLFTLIEAAGGLVSNPKEEWLFIFRHGKWDLPKGKIEKGEAIETAAIREVKEECGIKKLKIINALTPTYHTYSLKDKEVLKRTYWFEMSSNDTSALIPQTEEGITEVKWVKPALFEQIHHNTYELIKDVMKNIKH